LKHVTDPELARYLPHICGFAFVSECGIARNYEAVGNPRQIRRQILRYPIGEILLLRIVRQVCEWEDDDRQRRDCHRGEHIAGTLRHRRGGQCRHGRRTESVGAHRPCDVLDGLLAKVLERVGELVADLIAHHSRDADASRFSQALQPGRHVHPIAENIAALGDDVAKIDSDAEFDAPVFGYIGVTIQHCALRLYCTAHCIQYACKFHQHTIAGGVDNPPMVLGDIRIDEFALEQLQPFERTLLVRPHQPRIARHIGGEDGCEPAGGGHDSAS
jgi:hypothetical protein